MRANGATKLITNRKGKTWKTGIQEKLKKNQQKKTQKKFTNWKKIQQKKKGGNKKPDQN